MNLWAANLQGANLAQTMLMDSDLECATYNHLTVFDPAFDPVQSGMRRLSQC
ncbi:MAG: hypothetical protein HC921_05405 [Synechococcaceae cyanobacterium SM2_3_1]|nr:hypothetical protein [Synechococcaceae cyanobacterium SM2_3_1]